ncbi:MAG: cation:proton antiporter [Lactobacillus sp.]|nr:cation:proton antiporter [Lactobacillus sp.]
MSLLLVIFLALVIPIAMARLNLNNIPTAVAEIVVGIIFGVSGFNWIESTYQLKFLSELGVTILIFLSGMEIDFDLLFKKSDNKVNPLKVATQSFIGVTLMAVALAAVLAKLHLFNDVALATIIFMTVALGVVIATLKEKEILNKPVGQTILLTAVLGEVIPLLLLTIYASFHGGDTTKLFLIVFLFLAAIILLVRFKRPYQWFVQVTKSTTQLDVRLAFFLIFALVTVAETVGAENILGAFLAGMVMKLLRPAEATSEKLTSIGYGFFIPIFFLKTGAALNLKNVLAHPNSLILLPILVLFLILAKFPVFLFYRNKFGNRNSFAGAFLIATTITIVLPTLTVARNLNVINQIQSDVFTLAAIIVCVLSPIVFNSNFVLSKADKLKQKVHILGSNWATVSVSQELHDNWYDVKVYTDSDDEYRTYKSKLPQFVKLDSMQLPKLIDSDVFDCDILVLAAKNEDELKTLAIYAAEETKVERIIIVDRELGMRVDEKCAEKIEYMNIPNITSSMLRALIESPAVYEIITETNNNLYEVKITNPAYTRTQLMSWDLSQKMTISRILRDGQWIRPTGSTIIEFGDRIIFSAKTDDVDEIRAKLNH